MNPKEICKVVQGSSRDSIALWVPAVDDDSNHIPGGLQDTTMRSRDPVQ